MNTAPASISSDIYLQNLAIIEALAPGLASRLFEPSGSEHVVGRTDGTTLYHWGETVVPLDVEAEFAVPPRAANDDGNGLDASEILVFGVGVGDQLVEVLDRFPEARVTAWERDPHLLNLTLGKYDLSDELTSERLRFCLGADLLTTLPAPESDTLVIYHPVLSAVYRNEWRLLQEGVSDRRALIVQGGGLFDGVSDGMSARGWTVYTLDLKRLSAVELDHTVQATAAELLLAVAWTPGLAGFAADHGLRLLCWETDDLGAAVEPIRGSTAHVHICTVSRGREILYQAAGFSQVSWVPPGADTEMRRPLTFKPVDMARYLCSVAFVGQSLREEARRAKARFTGLVEAWLGRGANATHEANELVGALMSMQSRTPTNWLVPELLASHFPDFLSAVAGAESPEDPIALLALVAASNLRVTTLESLSAFHPHVWGDAGWRVTRAAGVWYRGKPPLGMERTKLYAGAQVNVEIASPADPQHISPYVFESLASGGFIIAPESEGLCQLLEPGVEVETWATIGELQEKVEHYLAHPDEARRIAERGLVAVRERHKLGDRIDEMLRRLGLEDGPAA